MLPCETAVVAVWTMVAAIDPTPSRPIWTPVLCLRLVACHPCLPAGLPPVPAVGTIPEDHLHHHEAVACPTPTILPMAGHHLHRAILLQATADPTPTDDSPQATTAATGVAVVEAIEEEEATVVPLAINAITTLPDTPVEVVAMVVTSLLFLFIYFSLLGINQQNEIQSLWDGLYGYKDTRVLALGFFSNYCTIHYCM